MDSYQIYNILNLTEIVELIEKPISFAPIAKLLSQYELDSLERPLKEEDCFCPVSRFLELRQSFLKQRHKIYNQENEFVDIIQVIRVQKSINKDPEELIQLDTWTGALFDVEIKDGYLYCKLNKYGQEVLQREHYKIKESLDYLEIINDVSSRLDKITGIKI